MIAASSAAIIAAPQKALAARQNLADFGFDSRRAYARLEDLAQGVEPRRSWLGATAEQTAKELAQQAKEPAIRRGGRTAATAIQDIAEHAAEALILQRGRNATGDHRNDDRQHLDEDLGTKPGNARGLLGNLRYDVARSE